jgi:hypothetical protein
VTTSNHLAEAARFAILQRIGPVLRHEVAGLMQPVRMLMAIMERQVSKPDLDRTQISQSVSSVSTLIKEASLGCLNAIGWMSPEDDTSVDLRTGVEELRKLLSLELHSCALTVVNDVAEGDARMDMSFIRTVLIGALLAFCDEQTSRSTLHIGIIDVSGRKLVLKRELPPKAGLGSILEANTSSTSHGRYIQWIDVQAMAEAMEVTIERGDGWLKLNLPNSVPMEVEV